MAFHIVLYEPEIPANTGNIARTCAATNTHLHLVKPLGFNTDDRTLRRAGLDYWHAVSITYYDSFQDVARRFEGHRLFYATTKAKYSYADFQYQDGDVFVFGKESAGLPQALLEANQNTCIRLPMSNVMRSLNLSNAAAIIVYEALRQHRFPELY